MDNNILQGATRTCNTLCCIFDLDASISHIRRMEQFLEKQVNIYHVTRANPFLIAAAARAADGLEVCSPGEYDICRYARVPAQKIVLFGVSKEEARTRWVMAEQGAGAYTAESLNQLSLLKTCVAAAGCAGVRMLARLTSGNQFGMDEEDILAPIRNRGCYPHLDLAGPQYYSGTQKRGMERIKKEPGKLDSLLVFVREYVNFKFRELEYGPGFQISHFEGQEQTDEETLLQEFEKILDSLNFKGIIFLETSHLLATPCDSYLVRAADAKRCQGQNYYTVDGDVNHVDYYGQTMAMKMSAYRYLPQDNLVRPPTSQTSGDQWTVCGSLCTPGGILVKDLPLEGLMTGDLLVLDRIGAYSATEGTYLLLSRQLPVVLTYTLKQGFPLVRDVSPTDILNDGFAMEPYQVQIGFQGYGDST